MLVPAYNRLAFGGKCAGKDAILAYHTALEFHGRAYSVYENFTYLAAAPARPVSFRSGQFKGVRFSRALPRQIAASFDVVKADRAGLEVRLTCYRNGQKASRILISRYFPEVQSSYPRFSTA